MSKEMDSAQLIAQEEEINLLRKQVEQLEAENKRLREAGVSPVLSTAMLGTAAIERGEVADETDIEACAAALVELEQAESDVSEYWRAIRSATHEYRKRAERARAALTPNAQDKPPACGSA